MSSGSVGVSRWRPEIDGLRAIAVIPVVLFHAMPDRVPNGYLGVDVFFVISGYLITRLIVAEVQDGRFSYRGFIVRRMRRILPALGLVCLVTTLGACLFLSPSSLQSFGASLAATSVFVSNLYFWQLVDYFGPAAEQLPLLHAWSLSVEEQFYLLYPLCLVWLLHRLPARAVLVMALMLVASALVWAAMAESMPVARFYLLPTRAWELLAGALIALGSGSANPDVQRSGWVAAVALVLLTALLMSPVDLGSLLAPVSVVALSACIIGFSGSSGLAGRCLSIRPLVAVGLVSYSLYLWHQPVLVFARQRNLDPSIPIVLAAIVPLLLALSWLSWRFVERPVRQRDRFTDRQVVAVCLGGSMALAGVGGALVASGGMPQRFGPEAQKLFALSAYPYGDSMRMGDCFLHQQYDLALFAPACTDAIESADRPVVLWGDSHAASLYRGLAARVPEAELAQLTLTGCYPAIEVALPEMARCNLVAKQILDRLVDRASRPGLHVIIASNWRPSERFGAAVTGVVSAVETLVSAGARVTVVGALPQWFPSLPERIFAEIPDLTGVTSSTRIHSKMAQVLRQQNRRLEKALSATGAEFVDPIRQMCRESACEAYARSSGGPAPVAWDYGHLTDAGSEKVAGFIPIHGREPH